MHDRCVMSQTATAPWYLPGCNKSSMSPARVHGRYGAIEHVLNVLTMCIATLLRSVLDFIMIPDPSFKLGHIF